MPLSQVSFTTSFLAGVTSFVSPCVLPLVPGYLSYMSGVSLSEIRGDAPEGDPGAARRVGISSVFFVLGFSAVFVGLGATASTLGQMLLENQATLSRVAGVVVIVFGLHLTGLVRIPILYRDKRFEAKGVPPGAAGAFVLGLAFAFGWTPCIGPILAAILALAAMQETLGQGVALLAAYSLGLGLPFLAVGFGMRYVVRTLDRIKRHMRAVEVASGALLIFIGALMATRNLTWLNQHLSFLNRFAL